MVRLSEIEARANAASNGPWWFDGRDIFHKPDGNNLDQIVVPLPQTWHYSQAVPDADSQFIAHAREDVPFLLAELRAAHEHADTLAARLELATLGLDVIAAGPADEPPGGGAWDLGWAMGAAQSALSALDEFGYPKPCPAPGFEDDPYTLGMTLCDDGIVRSGRFFKGTEYPCTGHAHFAGEHIECTSPAHAADVLVSAVARPETSEADRAS